jgi:ferredoxin-NADP reductase
VQAGDEIVKTASGSGALSVADTDALLYLPHRDETKLRRALQIPALSPGWRQSFADLAHGDDAHAHAEADAPSWSGFRTLRVVKVVPETEWVSSIYLADPDGNPLPPVRAGQYLTIRIAGAGQPAPVRSYSLSSAGDTESYRISVKREPHGLASTYLNRHVTVGATLEVAAPRGQFVLDDHADPALFVSAGIGITPVLSMLYQLAATRSAREIWWIHGTRGPKEHALAAETQTLLASLPHAHAHLFYSAATPDECRRDHATAGHVTEEELTRLAVPTVASAYVCGPDAFMTAIEGALADLGVDRARIHTERFGALAPITPGVVDRDRPAPHPPAGPPGTGPLVTFARSGISAAFDTNGESLLDFADACDIDSRWSCRTGVCQTCTTPLVTGRVSYRPTPLDDPPSGEVLICCSRPETDIVLDL